MNVSQEILDKKWFYTRARKCAIIHRCIREHEHNKLSWSATLALMVRHLSEANEKKNEQITKMLQYQITPLWVRKE